MQIKPTNNPFFETDTDIWIQISASNVNTTQVWKVLVRRDIPNCQLQTKRKCRISPSILCKFRSSCYI